MKGKRRIFSVFIAFCIIFTLMPIGASGSSVQQLYWIYSGNCSADSNGKIIANDADNFYAHKKISVDRSNDSRYGYFAYKSGTDYYAVKSVEITDNTGNYKISSYDDDNEYEYIISCTKHGSCTFRATLGNITYEINAGFELPYTGAYNSIVCTEDAYLDGKFHFETGPKDSDGNSYFYLIMQCQNYAAGSVKASAGRYGDSGWKPKKIKGLEFGDVEVKYISGSRYYVSKVTVTKEFQSPYNSNNRYTIGFSVKSSNMDLGTHSMQIYDSREIEKDSRLYWFYDSEVDVADDGLVNLTVSYLNSLDKAACRVLERNSVNNERVTGYFAVRKDTGYYAVNVGDGAVLSTDKFEIGKIGRDNYPNSDFAYYVRFLKFGTSKFTTWYMGKEYSINLTASLPPVGLYSNEERTADSYLDGEFHFTDGPKDSSGNSYFYLIADDYGYEVDQVKGYICEHNEENRAASMDGISVGEAYRLDEDYITCRITVSEQYRETSSQSGYYIGLKYGNTNEYNADWIHIYDSMEYPKDRQLYWFDRWSVNINEQGIVTPDEKRNINELAVRKIMLERLKNSNYGYFAVKDGDNYRAVKNVNSLDNSDIMFADIGNSDNGNSSDSNEYLYGLKCMKIGEYKGQFSYSENGNEYRLSMVAVLPESGAYATSERNAESFLNDEFHFADAAEKSPDGSTAYFYVITRDYDVDININKTKVVVSDSYNGEDGVKGISAGKVEKFTAADGKSYFRCKIAVTSDYKQKEYGRIFISFEEDRRHDVISIRIGDSAEYPQKQQLYSFRYWSVDIGEDGLLTMSSDNDYDDMETLDDIAERVYTSSEKKDNMYECCFAVKKGDSYYAVNNLEALNSDNISIEKDEENAYRYYIRWTEFGIYTLKAEYEGSEYMFNIVVGLPELGVYSSPVREESSYLYKEFHFADAQVTDENGAVFYLIGQTGGTDPADIKVTVQKGIEGIIVGEPQEYTETQESKDYFICPVTITRDYRYSGRGVEFNCTAKWGSNVWIRIYDSSEYSPDRQLYMFEGGGVDICEDGMLKAREGYSINFDEEAQRMERTDNNSDRMYGYFAVKKNGNYYAVDNLTASDNNNVKIKKDYEVKNGYRYVIDWSQFGAYTLNAEYEGSEYMFNLSVDLPEIAFYNEPVRDAENYLDGELHYIDAADTNESGSEAYFYLIASAYGYDINDTSVAIRERNDDYDWVEKNVPGISISEPRYLDDSHKYCVWTIIVSKDYKGDRSNSAMRDDFGYNNRKPNNYFSFLISYKDEDGYSDSESIRASVYDSMEIADDQILYWFDKDYADTDDSKKIISKGYYYYAEKALFPSETVDAALYKNGKREGWFAVKTDEGEYYAVDNVEVTDNANIKLNYDGNRYTVKWSDFGDYRFTAVYEDKEYKQNLFLHVPDTGFFSSEDVSEKTYLDGEFHFITSDNKSADGKEAYFYLIGGEGYKYYYPAFIDDNDKPVQSDGICFELLPGSTYQKQVWKVTVTSDYRTGYYSARQIGWFSESGYLRKTEEINIYDSTEVPEEEQLYWFSDYEVRIRQDADGRLESEDENCTLDECANRILRTSHNNEAGYFAIKKGKNEYYAVDSVKAEGFTVGKNKITGLYIVNRPGIGEYYCSAVDSTDGREYRMKVIFKLPDSGFYSSINEQSSDTFLGSFDYNTSLVKAFYYICPEEDFDSIGTDNINAEILKADSENDETVDGLRIGEKGSIDKGGNTYYYWKIEVADSYSFNREIRLNFSFRENTAQSEPIKVLGPVECGDVDTNGTVDFVDALWLKRHVAKWNGYSDIYMKSADVNNDGKADEADVMILERYLAGWEEYRNLPYKAE